MSPPVSPSSVVPGLAWWVTRRQPAAVRVLEAVGSGLGGAIAWLEANQQTVVEWADWVVDRFEDVLRLLETADMPKLWAELDTLPDLMPQPALKAA